MGADDVEESARAGIRVGSARSLDGSHVSEDLLLTMAEVCSLSPAQARERIARVAGAVIGWRDAARKNGLREQEIKMMADSIEVRLEAVIATASKA